MSGRSRQVVVTPQARNDFDDIMLYTLKTWGVDQLDQYEIQMTSSINSLAWNPERGAPCSGLLNGARFIRSGEHFIYYTYTEANVIVRRILHRRQHVTSRTLDLTDEDLSL